MYIFILQMCMELNETIINQETLIVIENHSIWNLVYTIFHVYYIESANLIVKLYQRSFMVNKAYFNAITANFTSLQKYEKKKKKNKCLV